MTSRRAIQQGFLLGILFSLVTIVGGEWPIGWLITPEGDNLLLSKLAGYGTLSLWQLAAGALFGGLAIPLQSYGYRAAAQLVRQGGSARLAGFIDRGAKATAWWGGIVHVVCVALMFLCRLPQLPLQVLMDFALFLVLPMSVAFMAVYIPMAAALFLAVWKRHTPFPKGAAWCNPLVIMCAINAITAVLPNAHWVNALQMSNMGLGSLLTFAAMYRLLPKEK